jgi:hypothetical protein
MKRVGMKAPDMLGRISTRDDFVEFVDRLLEDLQRGADYWQNGSIESFLIALSDWPQSGMDECLEREGRTLPEDVPWDLFAELLFMAAIYE